MLIGESTRTRLRTIGKVLFPVGIVVIVAGTIVQIGVYIASGGAVATHNPSAMIWGGIITALGIIVTVGGKACQMVGEWKSEPQEPEETDRTEPEDR
jgi:hypothetical protein